VDCALARHGTIKAGPEWKLKTAGILSEIRRPCITFGGAIGVVLQQLLPCWAGVHGIDPQQGMNWLLWVMAEAQSANGKSSRAAAAKIAIALVTLTVNILDVSP